MKWEWKREARGKQTLTRNGLILLAPLFEKCPNTLKYEPEKIPYLDTFHTVQSLHIEGTVAKLWEAKIIATYISNLKFWY